MAKVMSPYGAWNSQLSAASLASSGVRYGHLQAEQGNLFWLQSQPEKNGRQTILRYQPDGTITDMIADGISVRTRVHEYGGADFAVHQGTIVFANDADQCLYLLTEDETLSRITPKPELKHGWRYADMHFHPSGDWLVAVRETHSTSNSPEKVVNELITIDLRDNNSIAVLVSDADFYAYPRISPNGNALAWVSWNHPDMPWDNTTLYRAELDGSSIASVKAYMDKDDEAIYQPSWCPDGELHFVSDRSNWWNIYSLRDDILNALTPMRAEFGFPMWQLGTRSYQFIDTNRIAAVISHDGREQLCMVETDSGHVAPFELPFTYYQGGLQLSGETLFFVAASDNLPPAVYSYNIKTHDLHRISGKSKPSITAISIAKSFYYPTTNGEQAHAFFYAPENDNYAATDDEKPPLIVMIHGGPTGATSSAYQTMVQFWTNRGFAVVDVNYRGSSGFGRAYRNSLRNQWGSLDVDDCTAVVQHLAAEQLVDPERVAIRGGSAGGYTVYRALQTSTVFKAGVSRYGVADLTELAKDTHKFELRYLDRLIGPLPQEAEKYHRLSPINHSDKFSCPMLLLQGDEDAVVPPSQSIAMAKALDEKQIPHQIVLLQGEQHGFRQQHNIVKALELELNFYRQVFAIEADEILAELDLKHKQYLH